MIDPPLKNAVDQLLTSVADDPTELPVVGIAEVHRIGRDVNVDLSAGNPVVYVTPRPNVPLRRLTRREHEVALLAVGGFSNRQIALGLSISVATVKDHIHAILSKTGLQSRAQLIAGWYGGLLDDDVDVRRPSSIED